MMFGDLAAGLADVTTVGDGEETSGVGAAGASGAVSAATVSAGDSSAAFFAAFFAGARFAAAFLAGVASPPSASVFLAAAFLAAFFTGFGSSGCCSRIRPSRSARARTRSACCSMIVEDSPLTPIDNLAHKSRVS